MRGWIETKIDDGFDVPLPVKYTDYSGKFLVRIPKSYTTDYQLRHNKRECH